MDKKTVLKELSEFIAIESVSTDPGRQSSILKAVELLTSKLSSLGFSIKTFTKEKSPPLIIATKTTSSNTKTIGIYGHYDVQPEDPKDEWKTEPFRLTIKNGKMWARGIADDKGMVWQNIAAIENLISKNKLPNNIVFILEGEEEVGSVGLENFLLQARDALSKVDIFIVTDCGMHAKNIPQLFYGLRGIVYFELDVAIGTRDLHSGVYGNRVLNPIQVVGEMLSKIKDSKTGKILIPGFYDKVRTPTKREYEMFKTIVRTDKEEQEEANTFGIVSVDEHYPYLSSKIYPSFDCHGIVSGYTGPGSKTIIPKSATVKFSFRLVENQDPVEIEQSVKSFISGNMPREVRWKLQTFSKDAPFFTSIENEYISKTASILEETFGNPVLFNRSGGSIPVAEKLQRLYRKPIILTGFALPDDNLHSPNENFDEEMFWKGIEALEKIYSNIYQCNNIFNPRG